MNVRNLVFFDNGGHDMNFEWNGTLSVWEGSVYFPKVSVGLYANTNIYVMERSPGQGSGGEDMYCFPQNGGSSEQSDGADDTIVFTWDVKNTFVDEFFMFDFDTGYYTSSAHETSALEYTPNDGPEMETLLVNRFDKYEVVLDGDMSSVPLPLHVGFSSPAKFDATTFSRKLCMSYRGVKVAEITFYAETVEEDERLKILNANMGYHIKPEDTIIFKDSDIKECYPDYNLLNRKRKELMVEGHNIYPYIGSYKAIINVIKYFGYENLNIVEYWRNVNPESENFGRTFMTSKYRLTNRETINISGKAIPLPNRNYRKTGDISLVYTINHPTGDMDELLELPLVTEDFTYTMEEVMIKLFALRRKLNEEFMPASSRIADIIGEGSYFGLQAVTNSVTVPEGRLSGKKRLHHPDISIFPSEDIFTPNVKFMCPAGSDSEMVADDLEENLPEGFGFPTAVVHITDSRQFRDYVMEQRYGSEMDSDPYMINCETTIGRVADVTVGAAGVIPFGSPEMYGDVPSAGEDSLCGYYREYYGGVADGSLDGISFEPNYHDDDMDIRPSAKVILKNTSFDTVLFGQIPDTFGSMPPMTFGNVDTDYYGYTGIKWVVRTSEKQTDTDLEKIGAGRDYTGCSGMFSTRQVVLETGYEDIHEYGEIYVELPYVGYYDVEMWFTDGDGEVGYLFRKAIKVEPYSLDIRGFYYDARELPERLRYDMMSYGMSSGDIDGSDVENDYVGFILNRLTGMTDFALAERTGEMEADQSMPRYGFDSDGSEYVVDAGPYRMDCIDLEWCLLDNLNYDITTLEPNVRDARYIKNAVDVKPYTWFLLGFDESKITSVRNPVWRLTNLTTGESVEHGGRYLTMLLKKEGDYTVELSLEDTNGNKYEVRRNMLIVDKDADYSLYTLFRDDYDAAAAEAAGRDRKLYREFARLSTAMANDDEQ